MRKKVLTLIMALAMLLSLVPTALAADFKDQDEVEDWAEHAVDRWSGVGVIKGDENGNFNPTGDLTRAEAAQVLVNLLKLEGTADLSGFADYATAVKDHWAVPVLEAVVAAGIMNGTDKGLEPESTVTREQMLTMICRGLHLEPAPKDAETDIPDIDDAAEWSRGYIIALNKMGVVNGVDNEGSAAPLTDISRDAAVTVLDRLIGGYASEDGQSVEIEEGKITLIVADNVKVEGTADPELPIVVAGTANTVDMEKVEGAPAVQVTVSEVKIENAPAGTTVSAVEGATDVTVGDQTVEPGEPPVVVKEEKEPEPTTPGGQVPPAPTDNVKDTDIDAIIDDGRNAVNNKMKGDDGIPYAVIPEFEGTGTRQVKVIVYDSTATIGAIKEDIIDTLVNALKENASEVSTITAVKDINGTDVAEETNGLYKKTLTLGSSITENDVILFVKALVGQNYSIGTNISGLIGKNGFTVEVDDVETGSIDTKVQYQVSFEMASLDDVIADEIPNISKKMTDKAYASCTWDGTAHTLNVTITNGETPVGTVYNDIGTALCDAFNLVRKQLSEVKDAVNTEKSSTLEIGSPISGTNLIAFIKGLSLKKTADSTTTTLLALMQTGRASVINGLKGYEFQISVTAQSSLPEGASSGTQTYTIKFAE